MDYLFVYCSCPVGPEYEGIIDAKTFLFNHPEVTFQVNKRGKIYDKYSSTSDLKLSDCSNEIFLFMIGDKEYEVKMSQSFQKIGNTKFEARCKRG